MGSRGKGSVMMAHNEGLVAVACVRHAVHFLQYGGRTHVRVITMECIACGVTDNGW